jgi:MFS family permease
LANSQEAHLERFYDLVTGDENARVCKDIPDEACEDQPRNFFAYLLANLFNKVSDELVSARLTLPWIMNSLGVPASFSGFLVPIREAGVLVPQLFVAAYVRAMSQRKIVWLVGALLSAAMLLLMCLVIWQLDGLLAGWLILTCLVGYSLARGLCSVSAKDVLGKTISKTRRGRLMGYSVALAGIATLVIGLMLQTELTVEGNMNMMVAFVWSAGIFWLLAFAAFCVIIEPDGATEGGGNAFSEALQSLGLLVDDRPFQHYVLSRILLLSIALVIPFYVILFQQQLGSDLSTLGWLIIANGLASALSAPLVGVLADRSSRIVMVSLANYNFSRENRCLRDLAPHSDLPYSISL